MAWYDDLWVTYQTTWMTVFNAIPWSGDLVDLAGLSWHILSGYIAAFASILLYIPVTSLYTIIGLVNQVLASITGVVNSIITLGNSMTNLFTSVFSGVFPSAWTALLGSIILINIALRAYYFIKDIEILGNKI